MKNKKRNLMIAFVCFSIASVLWAVNIVISLGVPHPSEGDMTLKFLALFASIAAAVVNFWRYRSEKDAEDE